MPVKIRKLRRRKSKLVTVKGQSKSLDQLHLESRRIVLGIDPSLTDTGFAVLDGSDSIIDVKSFRSYPKQSDEYRIRLIAKGIVQEIEQYRYDHDVYVFIEALPFAKRPTGSAYTRSELYGVIKYLLVEMGIHTYFVSALTLKKQFAGTGTADKHNVQAAVYNRYGRLIKNDNIADAIGLASIGNRYINKEIKFPATKISME